MREKKSGPTCYLSISPDGGSRVRWTHAEFQTILPGVLPVIAFRFIVSYLGILKATLHEKFSSKIQKSAVEIER